MQPVGTLFVVGIHSRNLSRQVCAGRPCARSCVAHRSGPLNPGVEGVPLAGINGLDRSSRTCQSNAGKFVGLVRFWKLTVTMRSEVGLGALKPHCSGRLPARTRLQQGDEGVAALSLQAAALADISPRQERPDISQETLLLALPNPWKKKQR